MLKKGSPVCWMIVALFLFVIGTSATRAAGDGMRESPIEIRSVRDNFVTFTNANHPGNRIGYRFFEHEPIVWGEIPVSDEQAAIETGEVERLIEQFEKREDVFVSRRQIDGEGKWVKMTWSYYMVPVADGIEILLTIETYKHGLPEYYGVQQCFRLGGTGNSEWRREIACTPAFSEYDLWTRGDSSRSLTSVLRSGVWQRLPASWESVGARTPLGLAVDAMLGSGRYAERVGPYQSRMLAPIDNGLIARTGIEGNWVAALHWERTSHVSNHHPADCLHAIVNLGAVPPFSKRALRGKIYWFEGTLEALQRVHKRDGQNPGRVTVASCQFPVSADIEQNGGWIEKQMRQARIRDADLVHFPECALSGYGGVDLEDTGQINWERLRARTSSILGRARELKLWVLLGSTHPLSPPHKPHNSVYVIDPDGRIADRYDKRFCTRGDLKHYSPGGHFVVFEVNGVRCGVLICYDLRFPELYREYVKLDIQLLFQSFYNARQRPGAIHPKIMPVTMQARAATNSFFISLTNSCAPNSWPCYFINPDGLIRGVLPADRPGILISRVNTSQKYYDASAPYRDRAIGGLLHSGDVVDDPRSTDRNGY